MATLLAILEIRMQVVAFLDPGDLKTTFRDRKRYNFNFLHAG